MTSSFTLKKPQKEIMWIFADFSADFIRNDKCNVLQVPLFSYEIPQNRCTVNGILHRDLFYKQNLLYCNNHSLEISVLVKSPLY